MTRHLAADQEKITIFVPAPLSRRLEIARIKAGFPSRADFLMFMLQQIFPEDVEQKDLREQELIARKLRDLGYL